jgi:hypothetical protein
MTASRQSRPGRSAAGPIIRAIRRGAGKVLWQAARRVGLARGRPSSGLVVRSIVGLTIGLIAAWACARPGVAAASPLEDPTVGGAVFTGPVHPHATAIYENPAALGLASRGAHLYLGGSLRLDTYAIHRQELTSGTGSFVDGARVRASTLAPGTTVALYSVGERIAVGASLTWVVLDRFITGEEDLGYHTLGGVHRQYVWREVEFLNIDRTAFRAPLPMPSLAGAYRWRDFYFGVGVSLRASSLELSFLRDRALEHGSEGITQPCEPDPRPECGIENPAATERYDLDVSTSELFTTRNLVLNGGLMWQVAPAWWLGVHYQSPPGFLSSLSLGGNARIKPAPYQEEASPAFAARAELIYQLPLTVSVGMRGPAFADVDFFAAARWQNLSRQRLLDIRLLSSNTDVPEWLTRYRGFEDTFTFTAGLEQREGERLRLGGRLQLETATTPDAGVSPLQVEGLHLTAALGGELRLFDRVVLYGSYGLTYYPTVTTGEDSLFDPREQIECVDSGFDLEKCRASAEGRALPTAAGTYERIRHGFRAAIRYDF